MSEQTKSIISAVTTLIVNALVLINMYLQAAGKPAIEIGPEQISLTINAVLVVVTTLISWWRNNNITHAAVVGQEIIDGLKSGEIEEAVEDDDR